MKIPYFRSIRIVVGTRRIWVDIHLNLMIGVVDPSGPVNCACRTESIA